MSNPPYDDSLYHDILSHGKIPPNFAISLTLLRMAQSELRLELIPEGQRVVNDFYDLLDQVKKYIQNSAQASISSPFIIEVEGLDGSGKTTLVQNLTKSIPGAVATKTPSAKLKAVRPLWDHRGGVLARVFYAMSNYILEYEIVHEMKECPVVIVDRWYASTIAYTIVDETIESIECLPDENFGWPKDLRLSPNLLLVLDIDAKERTRRVHGRRIDGKGGASLFNEWDDRLDREQGLGGRILDALKRVKPNQIVNANESEEQVLQQALSLFEVAYSMHSAPQKGFASQPLEWWKYASREYCDESGKRKHHARWNLQVAWNNPTSGPPILKTVGLDRITAEHVFFWVANVNNGFASILWLDGQYPTEQQWRAEGYTEVVTTKECHLWGYTAPPSLMAHCKACYQVAAFDGGGSRPLRPPNYDSRVEQSRSEPEIGSYCSLMRFVPVRVEVLLGGPSSRMNSYPQRWEWIRDDSGTWVQRGILPFTSNPRNTLLHLRPLIVAITGCHTSGKTTIGRALSELLGLHFDEELGQILRIEDNLVAGGHLCGNGSVSNNSVDESWDGRIHAAECDRDKASSASRIVESWHFGNEAWYRLRHNGENHPRYTEQVASVSSLVLRIHLSLPSHRAVLGRRKKYPVAMTRLPMEDEEKECRDLFDTLQELDEFDGVPCLVVDNATDGDDAIREVLKSCASFIKRYSFLRVKS